MTSRWSTFSGVCIDTPGGIGFCAEHSAIAAMVTAGEYEIAQIVAVWRDDAGHLHVVPPCGRCRELISQIHPANVDAEVILDRSRSMKLADLAPSQRLAVGLSLGIRQPAGRMWGKGSGSWGPPGCWWWFVRSGAPLDPGLTRLPADALVVFVTMCRPGS